ncbi:MAG: ankyrin repeat domain-containing protein [Planctomycetes bacterium]|nr:ankyrin repeat domain-containing protein [Planctomycetota bacterium]
MKYVKVIFLIFVLFLIFFGFQKIPHTDLQINPAIINAIRDNNIEQLQSLILSGADINEKDRFGCTPLHFAISHERKNIVQLLIKSGADI